MSQFRSCQAGVSLTWEGQAFKWLGAAHTQCGGQFAFFSLLIATFGNPLQCSCLENPRDGGAWWAAIYGVAQSRTRLKWLSIELQLWSHLKTPSQTNVWPNIWVPDGLLRLIHEINHPRCMCTCEVPKPSSFLKANQAEVRAVTLLLNETLLWTWAMCGLLSYMCNLVSILFPFASSGNKMSRTVGFRICSALEVESSVKSPHEFKTLCKPFLSAQSLHSPIPFST